MWSAVFSAARWNPIALNQVCAASSMPVTLRLGVWQIFKPGCHPTSL